MKKGIRHRREETVILKLLESIAVFCYLEISLREKGEQFYDRRRGKQKVSDSNGAFGKI